MAQGGRHEPCPLCVSAEPEGAVATNEELQAQIAAAVAAALAPAQARIAELEAQLGQSETAAAVASATEPLQGRIGELEAELATAQLAAQAAESARAALQTEIDTERRERQDAEAATARRDGRVAAVRAALDALATDEWVAANATRWSEQSDEAFEAEVLSHKALAASVPSAGAVTPPAVPSVLTASAGSDPRNTAPPAGAPGVGDDDLIGALRELRTAPRT